MNKTLTLIAILMANLAWAQSSVYAPETLVSEFQQHDSFESINLLSPVAERNAFVVPEELESFEIFELNRSSFDALVEERTAGISLEVSLGSDDYSLDLVQVDPFAAGFTVTEMPSGIVHNFSDEELGLHYRGVVNGIDNSIVALSVFGNEVSAIIAIPGVDGNIVLGKMTDSDAHIIYSDKDIRGLEAFECLTPDRDPAERTVASKIGQERDAIRCPEIFFDISKELYDDKGGTAGATNYLTAVFNQVALLYNADGLGISMAGVAVWSSTEPFDDLSPYRTYRNSNPVAGDLAQYVNYSFGGGVAWLDALCGSFKYSVSGIQSSYNNVNTYSWSVEVIAHELGHNLGSEHTHACAWNGNNTAIDGCGANAGYSEGCSGSNPAGGGTIMSYCHLTSVGINFNLGFGSQVVDRITSFIDGSTCVGSCVAPTCTDGVMNGSETGVDCGGPDCPACPPCSGEDITLTILFDNYPEETTWTITDTNGATVESGGTYPGQADGSTLVIDMCIPDGCYDLNFFDTVGDGICCQYGVGAYTLTDANGTLASGGEFTTSETTNFCVGGTMTDCSVFDTAPVDLTKSFQAVNGIQDRVQVKFYKASPAIPYASVDSAACDIKFWKKRTLDPVTGDPFGAAISNPDTTMLNQVQKTNNNPLFKWPVKFRADGVNNNNRVDPNFRYEWQARCYCQKGAGQVSPWSDVKIFNTPDFDPTTGIYTAPGGQQYTDGVETKSSLATAHFVIDLYPNPTNDELNISFKTNKNVVSSMIIYDMFGKVVLNEAVNGTGDLFRSVVDVQSLAVGTYMITITNDTQTVTHRFAVTR